MMMTLHDGLNTEMRLMMAMMTWHDDLMTELFSDLAKMHQVMWRSGRWEHQYNNHRQSSSLLIHQNSLSWLNVININLTIGDESYDPQMTYMRRCDYVCWLSEAQAQHCDDVCWLFETKAQHCVCWLFETLFTFLLFKVRHGTVVGEETSLSLEEGRRC